jgi:hypothetical protein
MNGVHKMPRGAATPAHAHRSGRSRAGAEAAWVDLPF